MDNQQRVTCDIVSCHGIKNDHDNNNNNSQIYRALYMPTEALVTYPSDGLMTVVKQECLKMYFKTMFQIAQHDFCRQTVPNDRCGVGE